MGVACWGAGVIHLLGTMSGILQNDENILGFDAASLIGAVASSAWNPWIAMRLLPAVKTQVKRQCKPCRRAMKFKVKPAGAATTGVTSHAAVDDEDDAFIAEA